MEISPEEMDTNWYVDVSVEPRLPRDEEAEIMMALAATQRRAPDDVPLMSKQTARATVMQLRNPDMEEDRVLSEIGKAHPIIMASRIAASMKRAGDDEGAALMVKWIAEQGGRGHAGPGSGGTGGGPPGQPAGPQGGPPGGPQADPVEQLVELLVKSGRQEVARTLLQALAEIESERAGGA